MGGPTPGGGRRVSVALSPKRRSSRKGDGACMQTHSTWASLRQSESSIDVGGTIPGGRAAGGTPTSCSPAGFPKKPKSALQAPPPGMGGLRGARAREALWLIIILIINIIPSHFGSSLARQFLHRQQYVIWGTPKTGISQPVGGAPGGGGSHRR